MPESLAEQREKLQRGLRYTRIVICISLLLAVTSMAYIFVSRPDHQSKIPYEWTGPGIVMFYHSGDVPELIIGSGKFLKMLRPLCRAEVPVWVGMQANLRFHWVEYSAFNSGNRGIENECYAIDQVVKVGPDLTISFQ